jgi:HSP90 family molecular chaperone
MTEPTPTTSQNEAESFSFKAETRQLLNILIHSLYKDREVFLRELLSNASDALNRIRFEMLTDHQVLDPGVELRIRITADKEQRLLTIQDTGIGMTRDEIIENLGTIAQSGARKFMEATQDKKADFTQVIGQFGVGFYSVFMVAEWVRVTSRSYKPRAKAVTWYATGEDTFEVGAAEMSRARHKSRDQAQGRCRRVRRGIPPEGDHPQALRLHRFPDLPGRWQGIRSTSRPPSGENPNRK